MWASTSPFFTFHEYLPSYFCRDLPTSSLKAERRGCGRTQRKTFSTRQRCGATLQIKDLAALHFQEEFSNYEFSRDKIDAETSCRANAGETNPRHLSMSPGSSHPTSSVRSPSRTPRHLASAAIKQQRPQRGESPSALCLCL